jgi:thiamine-monophosphate kinase
VSEFDAIRRFAAAYPKVGDDAAVLADGLLAAADAIVEGIDFVPESPLPDVGWRAVAVNVSDIAAMGGRPESLLVSVIGPDETDLRALYRGIDEACGAFGCEVVGGDLSNGPVLAVSIAVLGRCPDGVSPVLRSGARAGDVVWATGPFGHAAAQWYRVRPMPRIELGVEAARRGATAMIDVSDGLAADLVHVCEASGVGVDIENVPVAAGATREQALGGGEDYELLFSLPDGVDPPEECLRIGTIVDDVTARPQGAGWQHRFR